MLDQATTLARRLGRFLQTVWLVLALSGGALVLAVFNPDLGQPGSLSNPGQLSIFLGAIATTLAAIVAIVVAVVFVALESLREVYGGYASREVFASSVLRNLLTIYLFTIALSLLLLGSLGEAVPSWIAPLVFYAFVLALVCLVVLFPATKRVLSGARADHRKITRLAKEITSYNLSELDHSRYQPLKRSLQVLEDHPLFLLSEIGMRSLSAGDRITPRHVLVETGRRLEEIIEDRGGTDGQELRNLINAFTLVFRSVGRASIERGEHGTALVLFTVLRSVHDTAARHNIQWFSLIEFNQCLSELACEAVRKGEEHTIRVAAWTIHDCMMTHLKHNAPAEEDVWSLHPDEGLPSEPDHDKTNHWNYIEHDYLRMLADLHAVARGAEHHGAITIVHSTVGQITRDVGALDNLGLLQKQSIVRWGHYYLSSLVVLAAETPGHLPVSHVKGLDSLSIMHDLESDSPWAKSGLINMCVLLRRLGEMGMLAPPILNELGAMGRGCVRKVNEDDRFAEAIVLIADTLRFIAKISAERGHKQDSVALAEVDKQLESLERWFVSEGVERREVQELITGHLEAVRALIRSSGLTDVEGIVWPSLEKLDSIEGNTTAEPSAG